MFFKRFGGNPPASLPGFGGPKKGLRACSRTSLCPYFCIFVLFFCADGRARARLPRQRANRVPARQQREQQKVGADSALSVRNQAVSKCEARACVLRPLKCRAENAGLGAQTEKKEEKEFFSTVIRSRRGSSDCSSRDRRPLKGLGGATRSWDLILTPRPQGCVHVRSGRERELSTCSCRCARKHVLTSGLMFFVFYRDSSPISRRFVFFRNEFFQRSMD